MAPIFDVGLRRIARGWEWQVFTFSRGHMELRAKGTAPFRWMARVDSRVYLRRNRLMLSARGDLSFLDGIDLR